MWFYVAKSGFVWFYVAKSGFMWLNMGTIGLFGPIPPPPPLTHLPYPPLTSPHLTSPHISTPLPPPPLQTDRHTDRQTDRQTNIRREWRNTLNIIYIINIVISNVFNIILCIFHGLSDRRFIPTLRHWPHTD